jgi:hypothetical protein
VDPAQEKLPAGGGPELDSSVFDHLSILISIRAMD